MDGSTPFHGAAWLEAEKIVRALLKAGADPYATHKNGWTPLYSAARSIINNVNVLLEAGVVPDVRDEDGMTPLKNPWFK